MLKKLSLSILALVILFPIASMAEQNIETVLCTAIENRVPLDSLIQFDTDVERIYLWTRVTGYPAPTVLRHVWLHEGLERSDVEMTIKGDPWRTWSYKTMRSEWVGNWEVKIVGSDGNVIKAVNFTFGKAATPDKTDELKPVATDPVDSTQKQ